MPYVVKRRYKSKNQQVALAGFTFGMVLIGLIGMIVLFSQTSMKFGDDGIRHQDEIVAEFIHRVDGRGNF